jgi:GT2 family glycosyltransferase
VEEMIIITPYATDKDLGRQYNQAMAMIPDSGHACLMDIDAMFLTPEQPGIIQQYVERYPDAVLTCYTNRISPLSKQLYGGKMNEDSDIKTHIKIAATLQKNERTVKVIGNPISGFLMVVPKKVWQKVPFLEGIGCLGVDTWFSRALHKKGVPILLMESIYIFHSYRIMNGVHSKEHLRG